MLVLLDTSQMHLLERGRRLDPGRYSCFLQTWKKRGCVLVFTSTEASELSRLNLEHDAALYRAAAEKADGQIKERRRVRDLPTAPLAVEAALAARGEIEKHFALLGRQPGPEGLPPVSEDVRAAALDQALGFLDRATEIGVRAACLERLPVTGLNQQQLLRLPMDELVGCYGFEVCVRNFARDVLNLDEPGQTVLVQALKLSDCPGFWLQRRLERRIPRGCREPRPSHHSDAERLAYLPYVDLLLTDKQMARFVHEIRNDKATPAAVREAPPAERIPDTMDALEEAICSRADRAKRDSG